MTRSVLRHLHWVGSSKRDFLKLPATVRHAAGYALYQAQLGKTHRHAKPLKGFGGRGVVEIIEDYDGDTYRVVYTVKFPEAVYVLHAFQKKSKKGSATPKQEIERIKIRLGIASKHYDEGKP